MSQPPTDGTPAATEALSAVVDEPFEDLVPFVQLEHELAGFETVALTRLDRMVEGALGASVPRVAVLVMCHAEVARDALAVDPRLAGLLPCTTVIYETTADEHVHLYHLSATKAMRDLGCPPPGTADAVEELIALTGEHMTRVWDNVTANVDLVEG